MVAQNAESLRLVDTCDLDAPVPVPRNVPWFPEDVDAWSVRWVILHVVGSWPATPPRRHHPRNHRRRNDVRAHRGPEIGNLSRG
ncbi:hypothetical protein I553_3866 [Mycobacterium xenopi 4042]|uniref:DinB superfamily protein n=1 Tax=Mycobacterium xenopi 4042 TaxID=1299334 RepID=X8EET6_MYCXE|nr:hypothetical protein I553_3866 [Mycobacterium xenopi 4042]